MRTLTRATLLAAALAALTSCSKDEGPDAFVKATMKASAGEPQALWKALPASYQKDVNDVIATFASGMNEQVWNDGFRLGQKATKVLETKKEFVLGHPQVQGILAKADVAKGVDPAVRVVSKLMNSDIATLEGLKKLDMEKFLAGPIAGALGDIEQAATVAAGAVPGPGAKGAKELADMRSKLAAAKVTVESVDGDKAKVKIEMPGEEPEVEEMVKVEGKWIPAELAQAWPQAIAEAKTTVSAVKVDPATVVKFNAMKGMLEPVLDGLLAAKTQDEFNAQVDAVMAGLMGRPSMPVAEAELGDHEEEPAEKKPAKKKKRNKKNR